MEHSRKATFLLIIFVLHRYVESKCDEEQEYELEGECCKMCGPGTRMAAEEPNCLDPNCKACQDHEYQPIYTKDTKCKLQPYCDPNFNFDVAPENKNRLVLCTCKEGYHCSSPECLTCVPHTECKAGEGVLVMGNATMDTVCQRCPYGTFSNQSSTIKICQQWRDCKVEKRMGTEEQDRVCGESRDYIVVIVLLILILALVGLGILWWTGLFKRFKLKKDYIVNARNVHTPLIPDQNPEPGNYSHLKQEQPTEQGNGAPQCSLAVENEEDETLVPGNMTENQKPVAQEVGKMEHVSLPESEDLTRDRESFTSRC